MFENNNHKKRSMRIENAVRNLLEKEGLKVKYKFKGTIDLETNNTNIEVKSAYRYRHRCYKQRPNILTQQGVFRIKVSELSKVQYYFFVVFYNKLSDINYIKTIKYYIISKNILIDFFKKKNKLTQNYIYLTFTQMLSLKKINFNDMIKQIKKV